MLVNRIQNLTTVNEGTLLPRKCFKKHFSSVHNIFYLVEGENLTNFADDHTPYVISNDIDEIISKLEADSTILIKWFEINECRQM